MLFIGTIALFISSAGSMVIPALFSNVIGTVSKDSITLEERKKIIHNLLIEMIIIFIITSIFTFIRAYCFTVSGEKLVARFRKKLFKSVIFQDISFFDESSSGELQSRLSNDTTVIQNACSARVPDSANCA